MPVALSAGREARRALAIMNAIDAHEAGDEQELRLRLEALVALNERLYAEQAAELGCMPATIDGCIAVLRVATAIVETFGGRE